MPTMVSGWTETEVGDGTHMRIWTARPVTGQHPGLIVLQEAYGVNSHIRSVTELFASEGFCAIAPELYHRTAPKQEFPYENFDAVRPHVQAVTPDLAGLDLQAASDWLKAQKCVDRSRISSVGFCMGGRMSFLANSALPLTRAVSFYGGGIAPALLDRVPSLHAPMLFFWGELDKHIPKDQRDDLTAAMMRHGKEYTNVEFSFADHGFFCDERPTYEPRASRMALRMTLDFLKS